MTQPPVQMGAVNPAYNPSAGFAQPAPVSTQPVPGFGLAQPAPAPAAAQWMPMPTTIYPDCPPGLEYLTQLDQILVHQVVELLEVLTGFETNNRFKIKNTLGQQCYYAHEDTETCMRIFCGNQRGFIFRITDNTNREVFTVSREFKLCAGCCWCANSDCCAWEIEVEAGPGNVIGRIRQAQSFWYANLDIMDGSGQVVLQIKQRQCCICPGPCCTCDFAFEIYDMKGMVIGAITKKYSGCMKECFTNATNFTITFPVNLDVKMKATLLGACLLLDMMFFEYNENDNDF